MRARFSQYRVPSRPQLYDRRPFEFRRNFSSSGVSTRASSILRPSHTFSMGTKYAILVAMVALAILSGSSMTLARSIPGSSLTLGAFDITNNAGVDIDAQCIALAEQGDTWPLGQTTLTSGKNWGLSIQKPASSIEVYAISCSFSMAGFQDVSQPMWEESNSLYDLPVQCTDCHWTVNEEGFALLNPANGHYTYVAYWGEMRVATPRTTLARSISGSSLTLGAFDITNNAGADIDAQCIALAEQGDTWSLGQTTLTSGKNWGLSIQKPASSIEVYAISCSYSMAGFQDVSQSMWEESNSLYDLPVQCTDCHWTVNKEGFALLNPANGHSTYVAYWDESRVTTPRMTLAHSNPSSSVRHYLGGFDITNNAGIDVVAQCVGVPEKGNTWALGTATVEVGSKWGVGVESPAIAISCSFSMAGFLNENLPVWQKNGTPYNPPVNCVDCYWIVDKQGFSVMNDRGQYIFVAYWTPPGF